MRKAIAAAANVPPAQFVFRLGREIGADDLPGLAAAMAYQLLFALFPFLIFLAALAGFLGSWLGYANLFDQVMDLLGASMPAEIRQVIDSWVRGVLGNQSTGLLTVGAAGALWGASGGVGTLVRGLNRAYGVREDRPFWQSLPINLATTLALAILMLVGVALFAGGEWLGDRIATGLGREGMILPLWTFIRGPGVAIGLCAVLIFVYAVLPNTHVRLRRALPGAMVATSAWVGLTLGFSFYVANFGSYDRTFGSLGAAAILMVWIYCVSLILLIGGEINSVLADQKRRPTLLRRDEAA